MESRKDKLKRWIKKHEEKVEYHQNKIYQYISELNYLESKENES